LIGFGFLQKKHILAASASVSPSSSQHGFGFNVFDNSMFARDYQSNQPASQQYFSLTKNQPTVLSASQIKPSEQPMCVLIRQSLINFSLEKY
jgi:hypothetical protein